jgi:hypothetical protein
MKLDEFKNQIFIDEIYDEESNISYVEFLTSSFERVVRNNGMTPDIIDLIYAYYVTIENEREGRVCLYLSHHRWKSELYLKMYTILQKYHEKEEYQQSQTSLKYVEVV